MANPRMRVARPVVTDAEFDAIDAIRAAFMACNAAPGPLEYQLSLGNGYDDQVTAMGYLDVAGRTAWRQVGVPAEVDLWDAMSDSGEGARYVFKLYLEGQFDTEL